MPLGVVGRRAWLWAGGWAVCILVLTLMPVGDVPKLSWADQLRLDKFVHAFLFGVQGVLLGVALGGSRNWSSPVRPLVWALVVAILFGAVVEVLQEMMQLGRNGDPLDLLADALGALAGFFFLWGKQRSRG